MILLAAGVSLDTWGIGVSYAVSGIKIPVSSKVVIGCINLCMTLMAVFMGQWLGRWIPVQWINRIAGGTLGDPGDTNVVEYKRPGGAGV